MGLLCLMRWVLTNGLNLGDALGSDVGSKESSKKASTDLCTGSGLAQQDLNCTRAAEERGQAVIHRTCQEINLISVGERGRL